MPELHLILDLALFEVIVVKESKLDETVPSKFLVNKLYQLPLRKDRTRNGGGILVYIKKAFKVEAERYSPDFELLTFKIKIYIVKHNFVCAYRPQTDDMDTFVS